MKTKDVLEHVIYLYPEIKQTLFNIGIYNNNDLYYNPKLHKEFIKMLSDFTPPSYKSLIIISHVYVVIFYNPTDDTKKYFNCIIINGDYTDVNTYTFNQLTNIIYSYLNIKDFLPSTFFKKIVYLQSLTTDENGNNDGYVFSEIYLNEWITKDPFSIENLYGMKITSKSIIQEILS